MEFLPQLFLVLLLILAGGFFTAAEYALIAVRKTRIDSLAKKNHALAKRVRIAIDKKEEYISTTQLGATIVNLVLGWIGEPILAGFITWTLGLFGVPHTLLIVHFFAIVIAFFLLTFFSILLSELVPKTLALHKSEGIVFSTILPITFIARIFRPFTDILNAVERFILKPLNIKLDGGNEFSRSKEELRLFLNEVTKIGIISKDEKEIINNVFQMNEKNIRQLLKPRSEIEAIDGNLTLQKVRQKINPRYSRFPVYKHSIDNIVGFIHIKDLFRIPPESLKTKLAQSKLLRKVISIPDTKKINEVFLDMRRKHVHMAIIYSEFGTVLGMVTLEDIIESVLGEIQDEFDKNLAYMRRNPDGSYAINGTAPLALISEKFHLTPTGSGSTTIGGHVFAVLGHEPQIDDKVVIDNFICTVTATNGKRITALHLARLLPVQEKKAKKPKAEKTDDS